VDDGRGGGAQLSEIEKNPGPGINLRGATVVRTKPMPLMAASLLLLLAVCNATSAGQTATVRGEATYRERLAVPPGAQLEVVLVDVSRADAPAQAIGSVTLSDIGQPPYRFEIPYLTEQIIASHRYSVRARLTHQGQLLFNTDRTYPVITAGNPTEVQLLLKRVGARGPASAPGADRDDHGCMRSAGYSWCAREAKCARPWELAREKDFASTEEAYRAYCSGTR
jgi:putative lipoprotein